MGIFNKAYLHSREKNDSNIMHMVDMNSTGSLLDIGCDDGMRTMKYAERIGTKNVFGVEIVDEQIKKATGKGIIVKNFDLNGKFDFEDNFFDVVVANQVIEHIHNTDLFLKEIERILKPGGYGIISTENASSWHNIFASIMGWQIFSLTNFSMQKSGIGNPLAQHKSVIPDKNMKSWNHVRIYNYLGLKEFIESFNLKVEKIKGSGYFPLPSFFGQADPRHAHFLAIKFRKL